MINHGYEVKRSGVEEVDRNLDAIKAALDVVAKAIVSPQIYCFVASGSNGVGYVNLVPLKQADGITPLYRALVGMNVVAAVDLSSLVNLQTSFEQVLSTNDNVKQQSASNLSADKILFLLGTSG